MLPLFADHYEPWRRSRGLAPLHEALRSVCGGGAAAGARAGGAARSAGAAAAGESGSVVHGRRCRALRLAVPPNSVPLLYLLPEKVLRSPSSELPWPPIEAVHAIGYVHNDNDDENQRSDDGHVDGSDDGRNEEQRAALEALGRFLGEGRAAAALCAVVDLGSMPRLLAPPTERAASRSP